MLASRQKPTQLTRTIADGRRRNDARRSSSQTVALCRGGGLRSHIIYENCAGPIDSVALVADYLLRWLETLAQDFIQQKQVGKQCAEMNGSVQIINQL
jgi:hypothetical protein